MAKRKKCPAGYKKRSKKRTKKSHKKSVKCPSGSKKLRRDCKGKFVSRKKKKCPCKGKKHYKSSTKK